MVNHLACCQQLWIKPAFFPPHGSSFALRSSAARSSRDALASGTGWSLVTDNQWTGWWRMTKEMLKNKQMPNKEFVREWLAVRARVFRCSYLFSWFFSLKIIIFIVLPTKNILSTRDALRVDQTCVDFYVLNLDNLPWLESRDMFNEPCFLTFCNARMVLLHQFTFNSCYFLKGCSGVGIWVYALESVSLLFNVYVYNGFIWSWF